MSTHQKNSNF